MCNSMKQKISLSLDSELVEAARTLAAKQGISVSQLLAAELERLVTDNRRRQRARDQALYVLDRGLHLGGGRPDRASLHGRRFSATST